MSRDIEYSFDSQVNNKDQHLLSVTSSYADPFEFWNPLWATWKFRRTIAYWISILFLEGSILFTAGAGFSMTHLPKIHEENEFALVVMPYLLGSICFTIGSYAGVIEAINVPNKETNKMEYFLTSMHQWKSIRKLISWEPAVGYILFTIGALCFNINTISGLFKLSKMSSYLLIWLPATIGSVLFVVGGFIEVHANKAWRFKCTSIHHWASILNTIGGIFFLIASVSGFFDLTSEQENWWVNFTYLVGSAVFLIASQLSLVMWKNEQFGLALIPRLNAGKRTAVPTEFVLSMQEQYGCGRSSITQIPWLTMYLINATASVIDVGLAFELGNINFPRVLSAVLNFLLSHGIIVLGSVIHHIPTAAPYNCLLIFLRFVLLLYTLNSWIAVFNDLNY